MKDHRQKFVVALKNAASLLECDGNTQLRNLLVLPGFCFGKKSEHHWEIKAEAKVISKHQTMAMFSSNQKKGK